MSNVWNKSETVIGNSWILASTVQRKEQNN
jgi:hypothetical protein